MLISQPFIKLPLLFDDQKLADEISQFDDAEWRPHPQGYEGNSSLVLVSHNGTENDDLDGSMVASPRLARTPYLQQVLASFDTVIGRTRLMRLAPGARMEEHTDSHYYWRNHLRIHIPTTSTDQTTFYCGREKAHMAIGEAWTFNNWLTHSIENQSGTPQIHLVVDTVGSAALWRMINSSDDGAQRIGYSEGEMAELRFEKFQGLPVMTHSELRSDLFDLVNDIVAKGASQQQQKEHIHSRTTDFIHDWHCQWMEHGPVIAGFDGFKRLLESFRADIGKLPNQLILASNKQSFNEAALFTLDAALFPDKFTQTSNDTVSAVTAKRPKFDRPVFIVAAPRSGSTLLFETLAVNRELWSIGDESHKHFESIASLRPSGKNPSNCLTAEMATQDVKETLLNSFVADLVNADGKPFSELTTLSRPGEIRFLEKTPKNALRIPFLLKVFPHARFIFLYRDARQNMSSLLETWRSGKWVTYPKLPGWPGDKPWSHLLIPGWQKLANNTLAEIVAQQWLVTNQTILDDLQLLPPERWCSVEYDSLLANTGGELQRLCQFSDVIFGPRLQQIAAKPLKLSKYTLSAPQKDKWKMNEVELEPVIESTEALMAKLRALD